VLPVPPLFELTGPVETVYGPEAVPVTVSTIVQAEFAGIVPFGREMMEGGPTVIPAPPLQLPDTRLATTRPVGNVSVNVTPVSATVFTDGLVRV